VTYSIGDSYACQHLNCDEQHERAQKPVSTVLSQLKFWHSTHVQFQVPDKVYLPVATTSRNLLSELTKHTQTPTRVSKHRSARKYTKDKNFIHTITAKSRHDNEAVYNIRATQNIKNQQNSNSLKETIKPSATQYTKNRMLLAIEAPTEPTTNAQSKSCTREITSINNNNQVVSIVCKDPYLCDMLSINRVVPVADFCSSEDDFITKYLPQIRDEIIKASANTLSEVYITSVTSPGAQDLCASSQTRRLLQTEIVQLTVIVEGSAVYVIDNTILDDYGNVNFTKISGISNLTLVKCNSVAGCENARRKIANAFNFTQHPETQPPQPPQPQQPEKSEFTTNTKAENVSGWVILPIGVILGVLIFMGIVWNYFYRKKTPKMEIGDNPEETQPIFPTLRNGIVTPPGCLAPNCSIRQELGGELHSFY
jgi:hypothetical protein